MIFARRTLVVQKSLSGRCLFLFFTSKAGVSADRLFRHSFGRLTISTYCQHVFACIRISVNIRRACSSWYIDSEWSLCRDNWCLYDKSFVYRIQEVARIWTRSIALRSVFDNFQTTIHKTELIEFENVQISFDVQWFDHAIFCSIM